VSRTAIWKQIEALRALGVPVEARGAAGYRLPWPIQMLDADRIRAALRRHASPAPGLVEVHWQLDSTSSELARRSATLPDLTCVLAESQSAGRGRRGRHWLSPPGLNLYLSCLKRFETGFASLAGLSLALGAIVLDVLERHGVHGVGLKWPNDLLSARGKLGGILVELGGEYQGPCTAIIGIGLNLRLTPALHAAAGQAADDLATLGGGMPPERNQLAVDLIAALGAGLTRFEREGFAAFAAAYARHDLLHGEALRLSGAQGAFEGTGEGVDARGALRVRLPDGELRLVDSADVTVRRT